MKLPWSAEARTVRQQRRLRAEHTAPEVRVRVTIERLDGTTVLSQMKGTGDDLEAALWNARSRSHGMFREIGDHLANLPGEKEEW